MRVGVSNIYSWKPHRQITNKIIDDLKAAGHFVSVLKCLPNLGKCYDKYVNGLGPFSCIKCSLLSVQGSNTFYSGEYSKTISKNPKSIENLISTVSSIHRALIPEDLSEINLQTTAKKLSLNFQNMYFSCLEWLEREKLDKVILFNGRFDLTKAILLACQDAGVPVITHERSWFGTGLNLNFNENCLSLKKFQSFSPKIYNTRIRLALGAAMIAPRFKQNLSSSEWREFSSDFQNKIELKSDREKILVLPSSPSEFIGEKDWISDFSNIFSSLKILRTKFPDGQIMVKSHPIWSHRIKNLGSDSSEKRLRDFSKKLGVKIIPNNAKADINFLIKQSDIIVTFGSSAALHAGLMQKPVILLGHAEYRYADFVNAFSEKDAFLSADISGLYSCVNFPRQVLEFLFDYSFRKMHFSDQLYLSSSRKPIFSPNIDFSYMIDCDFNQEHYEPSINLEKICFPDQEDSTSMSNVLTYTDLFPFTS